jgi:trigger factor
VSVVLSIEDAGPCRKQLKVEVPAPVVKAETQRVVEEFQRSARLPGFRKGKVPSGLIKSKYQEDIEREVVERLLPRFWRQAEAEKELDPLLPPNVDEVNFQAGEALTFLASVEVRPEIELGDIETFDLPDMEVEPTPEDLERAIEDMRRAVAEWVDTDRAAAQGDLVVGKLVHLADGEKDEETAPEPQEVRFEVGDQQVWAELSLEVTGKAAGQSGEFERRQGEGDEAETQRFKITLEAVKERDLPEMNDELAAKVGKFETVAELEEDVRLRLQRAKKMDRDQKRERALLDQLSERHPLELPTGVVDQEIEGMLREYAQSLSGSGVDLETAGMDWQALADQVRPQAERRVHARLLLDAVAKHTGADVDEDEFERTLAVIARTQKTSTTSIRQELDRTGRLAGLREQMRREKALKSLLGEKPDNGQEEPNSKSEGA